MTGDPTTRQRDHWVHRGFLHPEGVGGRGDPWRFSAEELRVANLMARLAAAGLTVELSHRVARASAWASNLRADTTDTHVIMLAQGITIEVVT